MASNTEDWLKSGWTKLYDDPRARKFYGMDYGLEDSTQLVERKLEEKSMDEKWDDLAKATAKWMDTHLVNAAFCGPVYTSQIDPKPSHEQFIPTTNHGLRVDASQELSWELEYERKAHRKTTELLIEKDREVQRCRVSLEEQKLALTYMVEECAKRQASLDRNGMRWLAEREVLKQFVVIVRDLFAATNSAKEHAACKAALAAYEEMIHAPEPDRPAPDPVDVGVAPVRHLSDCQQERPQRVGGSELLSAPGREEDRECIRQYSQLFLEAMRKCSSANTVAVTQQPAKKNK